MYIWTGLVFNKNDEEYIRNICKKINKKYNLSEVSYTLPQHISLKTSFYYKDYNEVIKYIKDILSNVSQLSVNVIGISKINNGVIWFDIEETKELRNMHNILNNELLNKYNIPFIKFDGDKFKFHSTLFQDSKISDKHDKMIEELSKEFKFPIKLNIKEINLGISKVGSVGTFKVCDRIELNKGVDSND